MWNDRRADAAPPRSVTRHVSWPLVFRSGPAACLLSEVERVMGIEPTLSAWEAEVLPLNYTRMARHCYRFTGAGQCRAIAGSRHDCAAWLNNRRGLYRDFAAWRFSSTAKPAKWPKATASRNWWKSWACAASASRWKSTWKSCRASPAL